jgi:hypothetical protein
MYRRGSVREAIQYAQVEKRARPQVNTNKVIAGCGLIVFILFLVTFIIQPTETNEASQQVL